MQSWIKSFYKFVFWLSFTGVIVFFIDFGFDATDRFQVVINYFYLVVLLAGIVSIISLYVSEPRRFFRKASIFDLLILTFTIVLVIIHYTQYLKNDVPLMLTNFNLVKIAVILMFIREFFELNINFKNTTLNPGQIFIASFITIIILGTVLLLLPNATQDGISFIDALFTSTSAVCVTGLIVVDTGTYFTEFGQIIIMALIQIGGLGILTFASYFSYFFKGGSTYENQLVLSNYTSSNKLGEVFSTLKYILLITFSIEFISAIFIYFNLDSSQFRSHSEEVFFSIFHAVSAFCNAGFSTLSDSLYEESFRFNYSLQLVIVFTFIFGGLGFPIVVNILNYIKYKIKYIFTFSKERLIHRPWVLNLNSRITLFTTLTISVLATIIFFFTEYNNVLSDHSSYFGKMVTALFGATTPRTAGFNTIDTSALTFPTIMMVLLLMWIGASPASTGGGIKTTTFAIATLNILSLAKGKSRIEIFRRKIANISVRRAFAIISLSLVVIGAGIMIISVVEKDLELKDIAFECFSAYSTVGLSLGITSELSQISKIVIILIMFCGRVSALTIVIALVKKVPYRNYRYPKEEITIN